MKTVIAILVSFLSWTLHAAELRPNIVVILLDNVGQERFGRHGSLEDATPNIDRLAGRNPNTRRK